MDELDWDADPLGAALLVHQTGGVGRHDVLGAGASMIANLVIAHLRGDDFLEDRESAAEAAALVGSGRRDELDSFDFRQKIQRLRKERLAQFRGCRVFELPQRATAVVQSDAMRKLAPRETRRPFGCHAGTRLVRRCGRELP